MTHTHERLTGHAALRWFICGLLFLPAGAGSSLAMRSVLDQYSVFESLPGGVLLALGGGFLAWIEFHFSRQTYPFLCVTIMGLCSGIAGAGGFVLFGWLLTALTPSGGIGPTIR